MSITSKLTAELIAEGRRLLMVWRYEQATDDPEPYKDLQGKADDIRKAVELARDLGFRQYASNHDDAKHLSVHSVDDKAYEALHRAVEKAFSDAAINEASRDALTASLDSTRASLLGHGDLSRVRELYGLELLNFGAMMQRAEWHLDAFRQRPQRKPGRPPASHLDDCCRAAHAAGLTQKQLATVAVDDRLAPGYEWSNADERYEAIERLRQVFVSHWPPVIATKPLKR